MCIRDSAATNEDLEVSVNEKRFRQDLLYRLHDFGITVPPLRDCQEDIMPVSYTHLFILSASIYRMATAFFSFCAALIKIYSYFSLYTFMSIYVKNSC